MLKFLELFKLISAIAITNPSAGSRSQTEARYCPSRTAPSGSLTSLVALLQIRTWTWEHILLPLKMASAGSKEHLSLLDRKLQFTHYTLHLRENYENAIQQAVLPRAFSTSNNDVPLFHLEFDFHLKVLCNDLIVEISERLELMHLLQNQTHFFVQISNKCLVSQQYQCLLRRIHRPSDYQTHNYCVGIWLDWVLESQTISLFSSNISHKFLRYHIWIHHTHRRTSQGLWEWDNFCLELRELREMSLHHAVLDKWERMHSCLQLQKQH